MKLTNDNSSHHGLDFGWWMLESWLHWKYRRFEQLVCLKWYFSRSGYLKKSLVIACTYKQPHGSPGSIYTTIHHPATPFQFHQTLLENTPFQIMSSWRSRRRMFADKKRLFSFAGCLLGAANKIYCLVLLATFQISSEQKLSGSRLADMNLK